MKNANFDLIVDALRSDQVVAYPTETVYGLGCSPYSEKALNQLLQLKNRPAHKGFILIAPNLDLLSNFVNFSALTEEQLQRLKQPTATPTTWLVPAKFDVSPLVRGKFISLAIRLCNHPAVVALCEELGFPLISTSANLSGLTPAQSASEVRVLFGKDLLILEGEVGQWQKPSQIIDLVTGKLVRA